MSKTIRDILNEFRQSSIIIHAKGSVLGVDEDVRAFETSITDAETAINAYILGEVMELLKLLCEDDKIKVWNYIEKYKDTKDYTK